MADPPSSGIIYEGRPVSGNSPGGNSASRRAQSIPVHGQPVPRTTRKKKPVKKSSDPPLEKPNPHHYPGRNLAKASGPDFKQQTSGESILKVNGEYVGPSESSIIAIKEAKKAQAAQKRARERHEQMRREGRLHELHAQPPNKSDRALGSKHSKSTVTEKHQNRSSKNKNLPSYKNNTSGPAVQSEIWEFDGDTAKSGCCVIQ